MNWDSPSFTLDNCLKTKTDHTRRLHESWKDEARSFVVQQTTRNYQDSNFGAAGLGIRFRENLPTTLFKQTSASTGLTDWSGLYESLLPELSIVDFRPEQAGKFFGAWVEIENDEVTKNGSRIVRDLKEHLWRC